MYEPGMLVTYVTDNGKVRCRVMDIIPEPDQLWYALRVTARTPADYFCGEEIMVPANSDRLAFRPTPERYHHE